MKTLITPAQMRDMEGRYFAGSGTASIDLMERAGRALADAILWHWVSGVRVFVACGPGGNGGDGYACARMLRESGCDVAVLCGRKPKSPDAVLNRRRALEAGVRELPADGTERPDVWLDALYGTGLSRAPEGSEAALIRRMNADRAQGAAIVAADIPTGLNGTTGAAFEPCVHADLTLTFQFAKTGLYLADGLDACGEVEAVDIGIPDDYHPQGMARLMDASDALYALPKKARNVYKGSNGHLLIVAGSTGMAGAAALCAQAALRSGVGLVTVACPASIVPVVQTLAPCAMCVPLPEAGGAISDKADAVIAAALHGKDAVVCGCGLSRRASVQVLRRLLESGLPLLLDADGLNLIAPQPTLMTHLRPHHLITPHPGEAARLLGRPVTDPVADALALRALGCQALLKGATTAVPVGEAVWLSASGCPGMAKGGSGDVLSGLAGGLMAQYAAGGTAMSGEALARCAAVASELHGRAGELAQVQRGVRGMCALDLVDALPQALMRDA